MEKCAESNTHLFELSYYLAWWFDCILLSFSSLKIYIIDSHFQENSGQLYLYMSNLSLDYTFCTCESAGVFLGPNDINFIITRCAKWLVDLHMPANFCVATDSSTEALHFIATATYAPQAEDF